MSDKCHDDCSQSLRCKIGHLTVLERRLMHVLNRLEAMCYTIEPQSALCYDLHMLTLNTHSVLSNIAGQKSQIIESLFKRREQI
jgi:hypothetical protein